MAAGRVAPPEREWLETERCCVWSLRVTNGGRRRFEALKSLQASVVKLKPRQAAQTIQEVAEGRQASAEEELAERDLRGNVDEVAGLLERVEEKIRRGRVLSSYCWARQKSAAGEAGS